MYVYSMRVYDMLHGGLPVPLRVQGHRVDQDAMGRGGIMLKWRYSQSDRIVPIRTYCKLLRCTIKDISIKNPHPTGEEVFEHPSPPPEVFRDS